MDFFGRWWRRPFEMIQSSDKTRVKRVMQTMMQMTKLDPAKLQRGYDGA
jgi:hypothetical protein